MNWIVIVMVIAIIAVVVGRDVGRRISGKSSPYPDQEKYKQADDLDSAVIIRVGTNIAEVEYAVNSTSRFLWTSTFDEEGPTKPEDRWIGINHVVAGDTIYFRVDTKTTTRIESQVTINSVAQTPVRIRIEDTGLAQLEK